MRVISGKAKGRRLLSVPGEATRPITDRAKSALFSILADGVRGTVFLDLFGGTGSVGIEALSRGASRVVFVERNAQALRTLGENLRRTGLAEGAHVVRGDAFRYLERATEHFDFVYIAPPQYQGLWERVLRALDAGTLLAEGGQAIVQIHPKEFRPLPLARLALVDQRQYGSTLLCFYTLPTVCTLPSVIDRLSVIVGRLQGVIDESGSEGEEGPPGAEDARVCGKGEAEEGFSG